MNQSVTLKCDSESPILRDGGLSSSARRGFTLVELLAVLAVIAVLAALLVPTLGRAKSRARQTACLNNLRQVGVVSLLYLSDYERYPGSQGNGDYYIWPERLFGMLDAKRRIFHCPAASPDSAWDPAVNPSLHGSYRVTSTTKFSYGYNDGGLSLSRNLGLGGQVGAFPDRERKESDIIDPSAMIMIGDSKSDGHLDANIDPVTVGDNNNAEEWPSNRHGQMSCNLMFCDGHVETARRRDVVSPKKADWRRRWNHDDQPHAEIKWTISPALEEDPSRLFW